MEHKGFTPGPWHRNIKPASKYPVVYAGRNTPVAIVQAGMTAEEMEANCDLIADALNLLAERDRLKQLVDSADDADGSMMWTSDHKKILARDTDRLRERLI